MPSLRTIHGEHDGLVDRTHFVIGYRLPPQFDITGLRAQLCAWAHEADIELDFSGQEAAFQAERTNALARAFVSAIRAQGSQPALKHKTGTSDMNVVAPMWGANIVAYGPGDSRLDHTPDEHITLAEYRQSISILETVLRDLAERRGDAL
jgi:acetylornithine deacetylase/succinyl-diaminopimelate desuccinylase-like protein